MLTSILKSIKTKIISIITLFFLLSFNRSFSQKISTSYGFGYGVPFGGNSDKMSVAFSPINFDILYHIPDIPIPINKLKNILKNKLAVGLDFDHTILFYEYNPKIKHDKSHLMDVSLKLLYDLKDYNNTLFVSLSTGISIFFPGNINDIANSEIIKQNNISYFLLKPEVGYRFKGVKLSLTFNAPVNSRSINVISFSIGYRYVIKDSNSRNGLFLSK